MRRCGLDFLGDLAAAAYQDDPAVEAVGYTQRPVRVQAAAVGGDDDLGEHFPSSLSLGGSPNFAQVRRLARVPSSVMSKAVTRLPNVSYTSSVPS